MSEADAAHPQQDSLGTLLAIEEIRQLKARYFRIIDTKDWAGFAAVFTGEATLDAGPFSITGSATIATSVSDALDGIVTVHHGHTPEIHIDTATTAHGIWAMEDHLYAGGEPEQGLAGAGHYHEEYVRTGEGWRIDRLRLSRIRVAPLAGGYHRAYLDALS